MSGFPFGLKRSLCAIAGITAIISCIDRTKEEIEKSRFNSPLMLDLEMELERYFEKEWQINNPGKIVDYATRKKLFAKTHDAMVNHNFPEGFKLKNKTNS